MLQAKDKTNESYYKLISIDQIGEKIAIDLISYFNSPANKNIFKKLLKNITIENYTDLSIQSPYSGKTIVLTGTLKTMSCDEAKQLIQRMGAKIGNTISKNTDYLIIGDNPGSKAKKAEELNVKIINEDEWIKIIKE